MKINRLINHIRLRKYYLACILLISTVFSLSFFAYFSFKDLFINLVPSRIFSFFFISSIFLVSLISGISSVLHAKIKKTTLKVAFLEDSLSYFSSIIIIFVIPLVALYPDHSALSGYVKPFFLGVCLVCCICLKIVLNISEQNMRKIVGWIDGRMLIILMIVFCCYILFFFGLAKLKYVNFGGFMTDDAHFIQFFYNAEQGEYLGETVTGESLLGVHLSFIMYIFLAPFLLCPSINTILLMKVTIIGLSGIPLYLIIKKNHDSLVVICILFSYLLSHHIAGANVFDFHEVVFAPFFLLFTFYFFKEEKFILFLVFFLASLSIKENVGVVLFMFGVYGLILGRSKKWILIPTLISSFWIFFGLKILLPFFSNSGVLHFQHVIYMERLLKVVENPYCLTGLMNKRWLALIYTFLQPVLFFIPLLSVEFIFVLPWFLIKALLGGYPSIRMWHLMIVVGFLFVAYADSLHRIGAMLRYKRCVVGISIVSLFASISCFPYWFRPEEYIAKSYIEAQRAAIELIPVEASVCAPEYILPYLADRRKLYNEVSFQKRIRDDIDFIIFDSNIKRYMKEGRRDITPEFISRLRELAPLKKNYLNYDYYWERDGLFIYKNKLYKFKG